MSWMNSMEIYFCEKHTVLFVLYPFGSEKWYKIANKHLNFWITFEELNESHVFTDISHEKTTYETRNSIS